MPPRGSEGLDFTPILTHYLFLFTSILAVVRIPYRDIRNFFSFDDTVRQQVGWFLAFISQAVATAQRKPHISFTTRP